MLGIGGDLALRSDDPVERALLHARVLKAQEAMAEVHDHLAFRIAARVRELFAD